MLYVNGLTGSDLNKGSSRSAALKTVGGAQARIKTMYPTRSTRPAVTVLIAEGDYYFGAAGLVSTLRSTLPERSQMG